MASFVKIMWETALLAIGIFAAMVACSRTPGEIDGCRIAITRTKPIRDTPPDPRELGLGGLEQFSLANVSTETWYDVELKVRSTNSRGEEELDTDVFLGKWEPNELHPIADPFGWEKLAVSVSARDMKCKWVGYEFPEVVNELQSLDQLL